MMFQFLKGKVQLLATRWGSSMEILSLLFQFLKGKVQQKISMTIPLKSHKTKSFNS